MYSKLSVSAIRVVSSAYLRFLICSPGNLDSSLYFLQPGIYHNVLCIYGEGNGTPLQYFCLENPMEEGTW